MKTNTIKLSSSKPLISIYEIQHNETSLSNIKGRIFERINAFEYVNPRWIFHSLKIAVLQQIG